MAPLGGIAHSRLHPSPRASFLSFSSLVSPLRPLGLGLLGRCDHRSSFYFYVVTDAGLASHRVRLWQGGSASTSCRFAGIPAFMLCDVTLRVLVFFKFGYWDTLKFASAPGLSGGRGEMAMAIASFARLAFLRGAVCAATLYIRCCHFDFCSLIGPCTEMVH